MKILVILITLFFPSLAFAARECPPMTKDDGHGLCISSETIFSEQGTCDSLFSNPAVKCHTSYVGTPIAYVTAATQTERQQQATRNIEKYQKNKMYRKGVCDALALALPTTVPGSYVTVNASHTKFECGKE